VVVRQKDGTPAGMDQSLGSEHLLGQGGTTYPGERPPSVTAEGVPGIPGAGHPRRPFRNRD